MQTDFKRMRGAEDLAMYLGCGDDLVDHIVNSRDDQLFAKHEIPKKGRSGGTRQVWEVQETAVADVYKGLARRLQSFLCASTLAFPGAAAHGYVPGRSTRTNASVHTGARVILKTDIRSFFRNVTRVKVLTFLQRAGLDVAAAEAICTIVVREGHVPLGLHTSPVLANLVCLDLDARLASLTPGGRYTRYADDLTFSGSQLPRKNAIEREVMAEGFQLAESKHRILRSGRGLYITGLSIEDGQKPRVPKALKRRMRQELHFAEKFGLHCHAGVRNYSSVQSAVNRINGMIQYIRGIEPDLGADYQEQWQRALRLSGCSVSYPAVHPSKHREVHFFIDESKISGSTGDVLALALVAVEDIALVRQSLELLLSDRLADPHGTTSIEVLQKEGLHWNALSQDDRTRVTEGIRELPLRGFVAWQDLGGVDSYSSIYLELFRTLLRGRLVKFDGCVIHIHLEQNSQVRRPDIECCIQDVYQDLERSGSRRPATPPRCHIEAKRSDCAASVPDLLLGIFGDYARVNITAATHAAGMKTKRLPGEQARSRFERVRDKLRAIYRVGTTDVYSRRRPFQPW